MLAQMKILHDCADSVETRKSEKLERLKKRIEELTKGAKSA